MFMNQMCLSKKGRLFSNDETQTRLNLFIFEYARVY